MGINFNIVKKPKVDEDDVEDLDEELDDNKKSNSYDPKKKMIKFMGIIVIIMIIVLVILFIISALNNKKSTTYSYSQLESILENAARSYFKDNSSMLPKDDDYSVEVDAADLVSAGKMNDLSKYHTEDGATCTGSVSVVMEDDEYIYTPILNCGDTYASVSLSSKVLNRNEIVTSGDGLYSKNGEYVFRGENVNNYVQLDNALWRIVKITNNDEIVLISEDGFGYSTNWDNRYNEEKKYDAGINNYTVSRIKDYLNKAYTNSEKDKDSIILSNQDKAKLVEYNLCIGKKVANSEDRNNADECKQTLKGQKIGLLTLSDYLYASVDPNCKSSETKSCKNYNYLVIKNDWWLVTTNPNNTYGVYEVGSNGVVKESSASSYALARPVIHLNSNVLFKSGKGTLENPYVVR